MINWALIYGFEDGAKGRALEGYWPGGASGVTIADGVDLGYLSASEVVALPPEIQAKIEPYVGVNGQRAQSLLNSTPLMLTDAECELIEAPKRKLFETILSSQYLRDAAKPFEEIPDAAQTVLMSVLWQFGNLSHRCPRFWTLACRQNWLGMIAELRAFGDNFPTRRNKEADYLEEHLNDPQKEN